MRPIAVCALLLPRRPRPGGGAGPPLPVGRGPHRPRFRRRGPPVVPGLRERPRLGLRGRRAGAGAGRHRRGADTLDGVRAGWGRAAGDPRLLRVVLDAAGCRALERRAGARVGALRGVPPQLPRRRGLVLGWQLPALGGAEPVRAAQHRRTLGPRGVGHPGRHLHHRGLPGRGAARDHRDAERLHRRDLPPDDRRPGERLRHAAPGGASRLDRRRAGVPPGPDPGRGPGRVRRL